MYRQIDIFQIVSFQQSLESLAKASKFSKVFQFQQSVVTVAKSGNLAKSYYLGKVLSLSPNPSFVTKICCCGLLWCLTMGWWVTSKPASAGLPASAVSQPMQPASAASQPVSTVSQPAQPAQPAEPASTASQRSHLASMNFFLDIHPGHPSRQSVCLGTLSP